MIELEINKKKNIELIYELQLKGIKCTNCTNKIKNSLMKIEGVISINVNVISGKVLLIIEKEIILDEIISTIKKLGFILIQNNRINLDCVDSHNRILMLRLKANEKQIIRLLNELVGVVNVEEQHENIFIIINITYNPMKIKGSEIFNILKEKEFNEIEVINKALEFAKTQKNLEKNLSLIEAIKFLIYIFIFVFNFYIITNYRYLKNHKELILFPKNFGIITIYVLLSFMASIITIYIFGRKIYKTAIINLIKERYLNMETLIAIGSFSSLMMAIFLFVIFLFKDYYSNKRINDSERIEKIKEIINLLGSSGIILIIVSIGKFFENKAKMNILKMTNEIFPEGKLFKTTKHALLNIKNKNFIIENENFMEVCLLEKGDYIKVKKGDCILVDCILIKEEKELELIDSIYYGENNIVKLKNGQEILSGAEIIKGEAILQVEKPLEKSMICLLSKQLNLTQSNSQSNENGITVIFRKLAANFVFFILFLAFIILVIWILIIATNTFNLKYPFCKWCFPITRCISVIVASCPCAFGLAIPSVLATVLNISMKKGILFKNSKIFENLLNVKTIVFDKNGTLFTRCNRISKSEFLNSEEKSFIDKNKIWEIILIGEQNFKDHPIGSILFTEALSRKDSSSNFSIENSPKKIPSGISFTLKLIDYENLGKNEILEIKMGNRKMLIDNNIKIGESRNQFSTKNETFLVINNFPIFYIEIDLSQNLRAEANSTINILKKMGKDIYILSGDSQSSLNELSIKLNIPSKNMIGEISGEEKKEKLIELKKKYNKEIMMIGDGLNDVLSLKEAGIGVSINSKSEINLIAADIIILHENLKTIPLIFKIVKITRIFILINFIWAFAYNLIIIPIAAGVFFGFGIVISPLSSSASMSASSLIVLITSRFINLINFDLKDFELKRKWKKLNLMKSIFVKNKCKDINVNSVNKTDNYFNFM